MPPVIEPNVSDAVRLLLARIAREKALPFEPLVPNAEMIEARMEARRSSLPRVGSIAELVDALKAND